MATSRPPPSFRHEISAHGGSLPALLHPNPKSILGIGFGAGVSGGHIHPLSRHPAHHRMRDRAVIPPTSTRFFAKQDYSVIPIRARTWSSDDARHYILTTEDKFDIIASDPLDVFVKGTPPSIRKNISIWSRRT